VCAEIIGTVVHATCTSVKPEKECGSRQATLQRAMAKVNALQFKAKLAWHSAHAGVLIASTVNSAI
jgi:hypothetical protein